MIVCGINKILNWCQIMSDNGRRYTCITKYIDGELCFNFKNEWHKIVEYVNEYTDELVEENGRVFSRPFKP